MIKFSRYTLVFIGIIVASISIPSLYWTIFEKVPKSVQVYYSCTIDDFVLVDGQNRVDTKGNSYTNDEYERLLPFLFFRQLIADGEMPDSIKGVLVEPSAIGRASSFFRYIPRKIHAPQPALYPMLESQSGKVNLTMPDDYFRINKRIEFIDSKTNKINEEKSSLFTAAMADKGFVFPAAIIAGIPSNRKSCDEGYFITDDQGSLFQVKMVKGQPFVVKVDMPEKLDIVYIEAVDVRSKEFYCYVFTRNQGVYLLMEDVYELQRLPVDGFDPETMTFRMNSDLFNKCITVGGDNWYKAIAIDDMYDVVATTEDKWEGLYERTDGKVFAALFPFEIRTNIDDSAFVNFYFKLSPGFWWVIVNVISVFAFIFVLRKRGWEIKSNIIDVIVVALTGIFGLIAVLFFPNKFAKR